LKKVVILSGVRTPVGRYMGALKDVPAFDLGALVLSEAVKRAGVDPGQVDEANQVWSTRGEGAQEGKPIAR
jgi:acetyl-CoA C-acetyltransferase